MKLDFQVLITGEVAALPVQQVFPMTLSLWRRYNPFGTKDVTVIVLAVPTTLL